MGKFAFAHNGSEFWAELYEEETKRFFRPRKVYNAWALQ